VRSHQNLEFAKARWLDFQEFVDGRLLRHGFIAHDARLALEGPQGGLFTAPGGETGADCQRDDCGSLIAPIPSARSTRKTHLITFEKALKNA
jgi:hypothetical protein